MFNNLTKKVQERFLLPKLPKEPLDASSCESLGYKFEYNNGDVFIVDMSTREHEVIISTLQDFFKAPNGGVLTDPPIEVCGQPFHPSPNANELRIAPDIAVYPNETYVPRPSNSGPNYLGPPPSDTQGNAHARIMCEIAVAQNAHGWKNKCALWMNQEYVRCVLGIKLYNLRTTRTNGYFNRSMKAKLWRQGVATRKWHFGTVQKGNNLSTGCNAPGIPAYQINIPIGDVFYDPPIPAIGYVPLVVRPAIIGGNFTIDLYEVQQRVLKKQPR
ncbi:10466_t:CDS:2 [Scutellospora calospora]|uniref:10466_t:CDS:1 n=1 Tax=Scutellospora calospora TaxID=85575 RepID=A0ACA9KMV5_9GLOM|nr:10466_t:CDS:2 [Scutellospora calospora]